MSDFDDDVELAQDELATLKARADMMGLTYHPSIGIAKLREKVTAALEADSKSAASEDSEASVAEPESTEETVSQRRARKRREANELIRIRLTCMNPAKKEWEGEIIAVGNSTVGTFKKYIPFNADDGWHVPRIIYEQLIQRQCQIFTSTQDSRGNSIRKAKLIKEFAIEVLPPLTPEELEELARKQALSRAIDG
jgi:hypothetical protein